MWRLQIQWQAGPSHMIMICWFLRFFPNKWYIPASSCSKSNLYILFFGFTLTRPPRLALLLYLVAAMGGTWMVEQPRLSMLRFHPRVMEVFSVLREPWLHDVAPGPNNHLGWVVIVNFHVITVPILHVNQKCFIFWCPCMIRYISGLPVR